MEHRHFRKSSYFTKDNESLSQHQDQPNFHHSDQRLDYTTEINVTTIQFPNSNQVLWGGEQVSEVHYLNAVDVIPLFVIENCDSKDLVHCLLNSTDDHNNIPTVEVVQLDQYLGARHLQKQNLPSSQRNSNYAFSLTNKPSKTDASLCHLSVPINTQNSSEDPLLFDTYSTSNLARNLIKALHTSRIFSLKSIYRLRAIGYAQHDHNVQNGRKSHQNDTKQIYATLKFEALIPNVDFHVIQITPPVLYNTPLLSQIMRCGGEKGQSGAAEGFGYLTLNQTRKVVVLLETDSALCRTPTVGIWVRLTTSNTIDITHPLIHAACVRYLACDTLQDRRFSDVYSRQNNHYGSGSGQQQQRDFGGVRKNETFLLMVLTSTNAPVFYEITRLNNNNNHHTQQYNTKQQDNHFHSDSFLTSEHDFLNVDFTAKLSVNTTSLRSSGVRGSVRGGGRDEEEQLQVCQFRVNNRRTSNTNNINRSVRQNHNHLRQSCAQHQTSQYSQYNQQHNQQHQDFQHDEASYTEHPHSQFMKHQTQFNHQYNNSIHATQHTPSVHTSVSSITSAPIYTQNGHNYEREADSTPAPRQLTQCPVPSPSKHSVSPLSQSVQSVSVSNSHSHSSNTSRSSNSGGSINRNGHIKSSIESHTSPPKQLNTANTNKSPQSAAQEAKQQQTIEFLAAEVKRLSEVIESMRVSGGVSGGVSEVNVSASLSTPLTPTSPVPNEIEGCEVSVHEQYSRSFGGNNNTNKNHGTDSQTESRSEVYEQQSQYSKQFEAPSQYSQVEQDGFKNNESVSTEQADYMTTTPSQKQHNKHRQYMPQVQYSHQSHDKHCELQVQDEVTVWEDVSTSVVSNTFHTTTSVGGVFEMNKSQSRGPAVRTSIQALPTPPLQHQKQNKLTSPPHVTQYKQQIITSRRGSPVLGAVEMRAVESESVVDIMSRYR